MRIALLNFRFAKKTYAIIEGEMYRLHTLLFLARRRTVLSVREQISS